MLLGTVLAIELDHYSDVIMGTIASQITSLTTVYSTVYSDADQRKHQSSASLAFVREIHRWSAQMASNAENVSIWWRHHDMFSSKLLFLSWTILPYGGANCHSGVCRSAGSILKVQFLYNRVWFHYFILSVHHHFPKIRYDFGVQIASGARDCEISLKQVMF